MFVSRPGAPTSIRDLVIVREFLYDMSRGFTKCSRYGSGCCRVLRKATADADRATTRLCRLSAQLSALGVCHVTASAAAYQQPAEAGADARRACTEYTLRVGHSSHNSAPLLFEVRRIGKLLTLHAEQTMLPEPPPSMDIMPKWCFYTAGLQLCFFIQRTSAVATACERG